MTSLLFKQRYAWRTGRHTISGTMAGLFWLSAALLSTKYLHAVPQEHPSPAAGQSGSESVLQTHYDAALSLQQSGDLEHAERQYRLFIADALGELAIARSRLGDYEKAAPLFREALSLAPNSPALSVEYAQSALGQGELSLAESLAAGVLKSYPANPNADAKAHLILGRTFLKLDKDADARHELEAAVRLNPNYENGYTLAVACLDLEDAACAARIFSEMQASFGDTASLHLQFGLAYGESDFQKQAIEEFQTAIKEDDQLPEAHYALAAAYLNEGSASGLEAADAELKKELQISPDDAMTYAALGRAAMNQHQDEKAETYLKRAISLNPTSPDAYLYLGEIFMEANRGDDAVAALRNAIRYTADVTRNRFQVQRAHYLLGRLLLKSGDEAGGRAELKQAQDLSKAALAQDKRRLGGILSDRGQDRKEESLPLHSAQNSPEIASAVNMKKDEQVSELQTKLASPLADSFNNLGVIAARRNDFATAVDYFRNAAQWNPSLDGLDYNWGRAEFAAEKFAEAIAPLSRYLASHPDNMESRSQLALSLYKVRRYTAVLDTLAPVQSTFQTNPQLAELYAQSRAKIATQ